MRDQNKTLIGITIIIVIGIFAYGILTMPDQRTAGERVGDALDALPEGVDKATEQLEKRTPGERLGDAVKNAGEEIKDATDTR